MRSNTYLLFNGQCEEAFKFYEQCFGAKINAVMHYAGSPAEKHSPAEMKNQVLHACMSIGDTMVMASDAPPDRYSKPQGFSVNIQIDDPAKGERIFNELAKGGNVVMPFQQTFWAYRFGMATDRFGIPWMINCEKAA